MGLPGIFPTIFSNFPPTHYFFHQRPHVPDARDNGIHSLARRPAVIGRSGPSFRCCDPLIFAAAGFTLLELMVTIGIIAILAGIAIPGYARWLPGHKLKSASRQLYSSMHLAKMTAIRSNGEAAVVFDEAVDRYRVVDGGPDGMYRSRDDVTLQVIDLTDFGRGVGYGIGGADKGAGGSSNKAITFSGAPPRVVFDGRGMASVNGYAHLQNGDPTRAYAVGVLATGVIRFRKWDGAHWQ